MYIWGFGWVPLGMQRILYGFGLNCVHLPGSYTANLYGQVSCDYTCSQSEGMVLNDLRKSHYINHLGLHTAKHVTFYQDM